MTRLQAIARSWCWSFWLRNATQYDVSAKTVVIAFWGRHKGNDRAVPPRRAANAWLYQQVLRSDPTRSAPIRKRPQRARVHLPGVRLAVQERLHRFRRGLPVS